MKRTTLLLQLKDQIDPDDMGDRIDEAIRIISTAGIPPDALPDDLPDTINALYVLRDICWNHLEDLGDKE